MSSPAEDGCPRCLACGHVGYRYDACAEVEPAFGHLIAGRGAVASWSYNQDDQLSGETYDQDGNVTAANGKTFSYDSQNQMLSMNGGAVQMLYDGDGNRVAKSVNLWMNSQTPQNR